MRHSPVFVRFHNDPQMNPPDIVELVAKLAPPGQGLPPDPPLSLIARGILDNSFLLNAQEVAYLRIFPDRAADYLLFRYKFRNDYKTFKANNAPLYLLIEPTPLCNLRCTMCFQQDIFFKRFGRSSMMDFGFFRRIVDEAADCGTGAITLASRGEPLLHPDIGRMLSYASEKVFETKVNTNATLLTEALCHELLSSGVNYVVFSIDSNNEEQYEAIRKGASFRKVLTLIDRFHSIREKHYRGSHTTTRVSGVGVDKKQFEAFSQFWLDHVDLVGTVSYIDRDKTYVKIKSACQKPCIRLWYRLYVWFDGKCNPCDYDYKSNLACGDLAKASLADVWNGERIARMRESHRAGQRETYHPCDVCIF